MNGHTFGHLPSLASAVKFTVGKPGISVIAVGQTVIIKRLHYQCSTCVHGQCTAEIGTHVECVHVTEAGTLTRSHGHHLGSQCTCGVSKRLGGVVDTFNGSGSHDAVTDGTNYPGRVHLRTVNEPINTNGTQL